MKNKNILLIAVIVTLLLMVPLIAMQFTDEVNWSLFDFIIAGTILFSTGLAYELIARKGGTIAYRLALGTALISILFLVWANLAVGLIGAGPNIANLMYIGVVAIGITGVVIGHFTPRGMERTMYSMAISMLLAAGIQLIAGMYNYPQSSVIEILIVNGFFAALFTGSALLFRKANATKSAQSE